LSEFWWVIVCYGGHSQEWLCYWGDIEPRGVLRRARQG
jgi:hypothetical protein